MWCSEGKRWHQRTIYRSFSAIYHSFILNGKTIISLKYYRSFFLNGIMVLSNNSIITIWWMVRKPGVGYQFADRLFYNFNVLFFLKKESFSVILFIMFLLNVYNLFLSLFSFKNDYWIKTFWSANYCFNFSPPFLIFLCLFFQRKKTRNTKPFFFVQLFFSLWMNCLILQRLGKTCLLWINVR